MTDTGPSSPARWSGLYAIVDPDQCGSRDPLAVGEACLRGGARVVQLRAKRLGSAAALALARRLAACCRAVGAAFVVNDRVDLAELAAADAVHLGQDDIDFSTARALAPGLAIGISTHDLQQARTAAAAGADYVAFGPIFSTRTKDNPDPVVGLDALRNVVDAVAPRPVVAIGGIDCEQVIPVRRTGAAMVAAIEALCGAEDPEAAARAFTAHWRGG